MGSKLCYYLQRSLKDTKVVIRSTKSSTGNPMTKEKVQNKVQAIH
jgi:hypothetical protein